MADWDPVVTHNPNLILPSLAAGATISAGAGAWAALPASAQVAAAGTVPAGNYVIDAIILDTPSGAMIGQIQLYTGVTDVVSGAAKFEVATDAGVIAPIPIRSGVIPGGSRIHASISTAAGAPNAIGVSVLVRAL
jgi:hypothetical protein